MSYWGLLWLNNYYIYWYKIIKLEISLSWIIVIIISDEVIIIKLDVIIEVKINIDGKLS